eukprot:m.108852 g.108852  ORF g.108852 m.108852 type:complete len:53 (-) comp9017_c0_seq3:50-208(-)
MIALTAEGSSPTTLVGKFTYSTSRLFGAMDDLTIIPTALGPDQVSLLYQRML